MATVAMETGEKIKSAKNATNIDF